MAKVIANIFFAGTSCYTDEGLPNGHNPQDYGDFGYIPVGLYNKVRGVPENALPIVVPGPGPPYSEAYWNLWISNKKTWGYGDALIGRSMEDLAGHAAAVALGVRSLGRPSPEVETPYRKELFDIIETGGIHARSRALSGSEEMKCLQFDDGALELLSSKISRDKMKIEDGDIINLCGHSRGGVACIIASHDLNRLFPGVKVNIFAIDPVPGGGGNWTYEMTHLAPNVHNYIGVYAIDEVSAFFNGVVPWPSTAMMGNPKDPLGTGQAWGRNPKGYMLFYAPGRHATVAGNIGATGNSITAKADKAGVPQRHLGHLVGTLATLAFQKWGVNLANIPTIKRTWNRSVATIGTNLDTFRAMRRYTYDSVISGDWYGLNPLNFHWTERGISSASGKWNSTSWCYLEDAIDQKPLVARKTWGSGLLIDYNAKQRRAANWFPLNNYYDEVAKFLVGNLR